MERSNPFGRSGGSAADTRYTHATSWIAASARIRLRTASVATLLKVYAKPNTKEERRDAAGRERSRNKYPGPMNQFVPKLTPGTGLFSSLLCLTY